jgi:hypothetical protein
MSFRGAQRREIPQEALWHTNLDVALLSQLIEQLDKRTVLTLTHHKFIG